MDDKIVKDALSMFVIIFFSMSTVPFFCASVKALSNACKSTTYPINLGSSS